MYNKGQDDYESMPLPYSVNELRSLGIGDDSDLSSDHMTYLSLPITRSGGFTR
jgi:hypothetical protein